jgi:hypothetical protein
MMLGFDSYGGLKRPKIRTAIAILDDSLTINDCRFTAEFCSGTDNAGITVAPIMSIPAKDTHLAALNHHLGSVAIVFDFVNPVLALWWLFDRTGKPRLNEPEPCRYAKHWALACLQKKPRNGSNRASSP